MIALLSRDAIVTFPEGSITTTVSVKFAKLTADQFPEIFPENGQNITVWFEKRNFSFFIKIFFF